MADTPKHGAPMTEDVAAWPGPSSANPTPVQTCSYCGRPAIKTDGAAEWWCGVIDCDLPHPNKETTA